MQLTTTKDSFVPFGTFSRTTPVQHDPRTVQPSATRLVTICAIAFSLTAPGQTAAVSAFVDPLIDDLGVSRSAVSTAYLIGSLSGGLVMPFLGRLIDRFSPRVLMSAIALCFGAVLIASSLIAGVPSLTAAFTGMRVGGQGALSLVATTTVAAYIERRRGLAMGITSAIGTAAISLAPLALECIIHDQGWRTALLLEGLAVLALVVPASLFLPPGPRTGTNPPADGATHSEMEYEAGSVGTEKNEPAVAGLSLRQALRTGIFWVVTLGVGVLQASSAPDSTFTSCPCSVSVASAPPRLRPPSCRRWLPDSPPPWYSAGLPTRSPTSS
ncbi:MFS transporter [Streptomyces sp. NPDC024089]|uniref:MFS transporter n=1 Tax=Streptomyces sp. NPDC024089 TaxID=3154328 RepID=UPI0033EADD4C